MVMNCRKQATMQQSEADIPISIFGIYYHKLKFDNEKLIKRRKFRVDS